jgi:hypothetical protein
MKYLKYPEINLRVYKIDPKMNLGGIPKFSI